MSKNFFSFLSENVYRHKVDLRSVVLDIFGLIVVWFSTIKMNRINSQLS